MHRCGGHHGCGGEARLIAELGPGRVLFICSCGAFDDHLAIGDVIEVAEALSISIEEVEGRAYRPRIEHVRWPATLVFEPPLAFPTCTVAVPSAITKTAEEAETLSKWAAAEHLEVTGVFAACHGAGVPCSSGRDKSCGPRGPHGMEGQQRARESCVGGDAENEGCVQRAKVRTSGGFKPVPLDRHMASLFQKQGEK
jgi:hypothetical protein